MKAYPFFSAAVFAAIISTFSCSSNDDGNANVESNGSSQSYSYCLKNETCLGGPFTLNDCNSLGGLPSNSCPYSGVSSSSSKPSSSSSSSYGKSSSSAFCTVAYNTETHYCSDGTIKEYGFVTDDGGQTYKTVVIGDQTWMAENLNYNASGICYAYDPANCATYGRLYDWSTAMALPSSCNDRYCSSQRQAQTKHRGVCPSGWHLPSDAEWTALTDFVGSNKAGANLRATAWTSYSYLKTAEFGFSALPGGVGSGSGGSGVGNRGYWWSATENVAPSAYYRSIYSQYTEVLRDRTSKSGLFSVRCVQGPAGCTAADNTETHYCSNGTIKEYGSVTDDGGQTYKTVVIGDQTWMAENLNYDPGTGNSARYENCDKCGRRYDWSTAMGFSSNCNSRTCRDNVQTKYRGVCPSGWHLPSDAEWTALTNFVGSDRAGTQLKATEGWSDWKGVSGNGIDNYGFSALPGGIGNSSVLVGSSGYWWSTSEYNSDVAYYNSDRAYSWYVEYTHGYAESNSSDKSYLFSVRCLQD